MGSEVIRTMNAKGRADLLLFDPEDLTLVDDTAHPLYDERVHWPIDEAMVLNIMEHGVIESISVRRNGERNGIPVVEVAEGRQRVKNAREANRRLKKDGREPIRVPGVHKRGDDAKLFGIMISANEHRRQDGHVMRARKIQRYIDMGRSQEDAAALFNCSVATVGNLLALLECSPVVQDAVERGKIGATLAEKHLSKLSREEQPAALAELIASGATKGEAAEEAVRRIRAGAPANDGAKVAPKRMRSRPFIERWKRALAKVDRVDTRVAVAVLSYVLGGERSLSDFEHILEAAKSAEK